MDKTLLAPMFLPRGILQVTCDNTLSRYSVNGGSNPKPEPEGSGGGDDVNCAALLFVLGPVVDGGRVGEADVGRVLAALLISRSKASNTALGVAVVVEAPVEEVVLVVGVGYCRVLLVILLVGVAPTPTKERSFSLSNRKSSSTISMRTNRLDEDDMLLEEEGFFMVRTSAN